MQPDKVISETINVRDCIKNRIWTRQLNELELRRYRWLEEITCDIDCEDSRLSEVEQIESFVRSSFVTCHPKGPSLVMKRINQDKMMLDNSEVRTSRSTYIISLYSKFNIIYSFSRLHQPGDDDDYDAAGRVPRLGRL